MAGDPPARRQDRPAPSARSEGIGRSHTTDRHITGVPMTAGPLFDWAIVYAQIGLRVLPVNGIRGDGRCTCGKQDCDNPGKHPIAGLVPHGAKDATTDEAVIRGWWASGPDANVGIATDGLLV